MSEDNYLKSGFGVLWCFLEALYFPFYSISDICVTFL